MRLYTVGHGTTSQDELSALLQGAGITGVIDVRRHPGSRRHPHVNRGELQDWLPRVGIEYRWEERLGGRRSGAADSPHTVWRNASFRAYADHTGSQAFRTALREVLDTAEERPTGVMCAESLWWRCHRRLIADAAALLHDAEVCHLMHDGRLQQHPPMSGARVVEGELRYDGGAPV